MPGRRPCGRRRGGSPRLRPAQPRAARLGASSAGRLCGYERRRLGQRGRRLGGRPAAGARLGGQLRLAAGSAAGGSAAGAAWPARLGGGLSGSGLAGRLDLVDLGDGAASSSSSLRHWSPAPAVNEAPAKKSVVKRGTSARRRRDRAAAAAAAPARVRGLLACRPSRLAATHEMQHATATLAGRATVGTSRDSDSVLASNPAPPFVRRRECPSGASECPTAPPRFRLNHFLSAGALARFTRIG